MINLRSMLRLKKRTKALCRSYSKDWVLVLVVMVSFGVIDQLEPFHRQFSVTDKAIRHPFAKKETVPAGLLAVLAFLVPMTMIVAVSVFMRRSYTDLHNGMLGLFLTQALVLIVTDSVKITVGRPRPDLLDRCLSLYDNEANGTPLGQLSDPINLLSNSSICTRRELLRDGFKSFPSGHSSFSFGGLGYLSMYFAGKLHLFDERGHIYKSLVCLAPMILAALIATSRVADYRHHWEDVTAGSFMGMVFAVFSYRQYYPSLASTSSDRPFAPRVRDDLSLPSSASSTPRGSSSAPYLRYRDDDDDEDDDDQNDEDRVDPESGVGEAQRAQDAASPGLSGMFFRRERDGTNETLTATGHDLHALGKDQGKSSGNRLQNGSSTSSSSASSRDPQTGQLISV